jgi:hypothetical protein
VRHPTLSSILDYLIYAIYERFAIWAVLAIAGGKMHATIRRYLICKPRFALLLLLALAGLAATNMFHSQRAEAASGDPIIHWDSSMIYPGQNNGYPWGPVGEQARIHGAKFTAGEVVGQTIKLALLQGDVNNPPGGGSSYEFCKLAGPKLAIGQANVDGSGAFDFNFAWPASAGSGMYSVCAYNTLDGLPVGNIDDGPFTVLSSHAPSVAVSHTSVAAGESVTVTGKNWTPPQDVNVYIAACVDCDGPIVVAGTAHSSGLNAGTFSITFTIPATATPGDYVAGANAHSVLDVGPAGGKHIAITAAVATPTVAATVTAAQSTAAAGSGTGNTNNSGGLAGLSPLVLILAGAGILVLLLLIILLIVALSRRGSNKTPPGSTMGGATPDWGRPGSPAGGYLPYGGGTAPPAGGSVQQNWQTLPPGWGDQTPPTVSQDMPQGDDSPTRPGTYGG